MDEHEQRLDQLFLEAFGTNHPAMLDWVEIKFRLKRADKIEAALWEAERELSNASQQAKNREWCDHYEGYAQMCRDALPSATKLKTEVKA